MAISREHHSLFLFQQAANIVGFAGTRWAFLGNQRFRGAPRKTFDRGPWQEWFGCIDLPHGDLPKNAGNNLHPARPWLEWLGADECLMIDSNGKDGCCQHDLNLPMPAEYHGRYHVVANFGTSEHVWPNQKQVFRTCHDLCKPGGVILHAIPAHGCRKHGHWLCDAAWFKRLADEQFYGIELLEHRPVPHKASGRHEYSVAIFHKLTDDPFSLRGWREPELNAGSARQLTSVPQSA